MNKVKKIYEEMENKIWFWLTLIGLFALCCVGFALLNGWLYLTLR